MDPWGPEWDVDVWFFSCRPPDFFASPHGGESGRLIDEQVSKLL